MKKGGDKSFEKIYKSYFLPVYRYIFYRVGNKEVAEDLVQTVFLKIYRNAENYSNRENLPISIFFVTAKNAIIDYGRKKKEIFLENFEKEMDLKPAEKESGFYEKNDLPGVVLGALKNLNSIQREIVVLRFINGMSTKEIAEICKKSRETVRQNQCRALKKLRKILNLKKDEKKKK